MRRWKFRGIKHRHLYLCPDPRCIRRDAPRFECLARLSRTISSDVDAEFRYEIGLADVQHFLIANGRVFRRFPSAFVLASRLLWAHSGSG